MYIVGVVTIASKVVIGFKLLRVMKKKLHKPYKNVKRSVCITILASIIVISYNTFLNFSVGSSFGVFWEHIVEPTDIDFWSLLKEAIFSFTNLCAESFLMFFTAKNIDFKFYLDKLMEGRKVSHLLPTASIFLMHVPCKTIKVD